MILQELTAHYDRLHAAGTQGLPEIAFSREKIGFVLRIDGDGTPLDTIAFDTQLTPKREGAKPKVLPYREMEVPKHTDRTSGVLSFFLWDKTAYTLGVDPDVKTDRLQQQFSEFKRLHHEIGAAIDETEMRAVLAFLDRWRADMVDGVPGLPDLLGRNMVFEVAGYGRFVHENPTLRAAWRRYAADQEGDRRGMCLVTGEMTTLARIHPPIRGVWGAQSSGAAIVSFNDPAYESYHKKQSYNAPVGVTAAQKYTKALNYLLRIGSENIVTVADTSVVYWSEEPTIVQSAFGSLVARPNDIVTDPKIRAFLEALRNGTYADEVRGDNAFCLLGLAAPSKARISIRYWYRSTIAELASRLHSHVNDTCIEALWDDDPPNPSLWHYLVAITPRGKSADIKAGMHEALLRSVMTGAPYPRWTLLAALDRIRTGDRRRRAYDTWRAGLIRGYLRRRYYDPDTGNYTKEVPMALEPNNQESAYQLGRLFAVYERIQESAAGGRTINRTIKDRYYTSAASRPMRTFAVIDRLSRSHMKKLSVRSKIGLKVKYDKLLGEIHAALGPASYPTTLNLEDQGLFTLGYYHQRRALFPKSTTEGTGTPETDERQEETDG